MLKAHAIENLPHLGAARIHVLKSKWYPDENNSMTARFLDVMKKAGCEDIPVHTISGSLAIPLAAQDLVDTYKDIEAIVCFGILMKGETAHFEMIMNTLSTAFATLTLGSRVPIINCIIPATSFDQVRARTGNDEHNKGLEAALAAIETIIWRRNLRGE